MRFDSVGEAVRRRLERLRSLVAGLTLLHLWFLGFLYFPGARYDSLAFLQLFGIFFLAPLVYFVIPLVALVRDSDDPEPRDWIDMGHWREWVVAYAMLPVTLLNPLILVQDLMQAAGGAISTLRYRGSSPSVDTYEQSVSYRLPFDGTWTAFNGSYEREYSHSWMYLNQRYAYDFIITDDEGRSRPPDAPARADEYYCYDEPILAPAEGVVVDAWDGAFESRRAGGISHACKRDIRGAYVVIKHAPAEYSALVHLVPGSVTVEAGEVVESGQEIGRCGHTGNSSEPHLHFQVQDHPNFQLAAGLPITFEDCYVETPVEGFEPPQEPTESEAPGEYYERAHIQAGQRVSHAGRNDPQVADKTSAETADTADQPLPVSTAFARRFGLGLASAGVVAAVVTGFLTWWLVAGVLGLAAVAGIGLRLAWTRRWGEFTPRPGSVGAPLAAGLVALLLAADGFEAVALPITSAVLGGVCFVSGLTIYAVAGQVDGWRLAQLKVPTDENEPTA